MSSAQVHREGHSKTGINKSKGMGAEENDVEIGTDQTYGLGGEQGQVYKIRRRKCWVGLAVLKDKPKGLDLVLQPRGQQPFSVKDQTVNILTSVDHVLAITTTQPCHHSTKQ